MRLLLVAALALFLAGCGSEEAGEVAAPTTVTVTQTETVAETVTAEPEATCTAADLQLDLPAQDVPEPVAGTRQRVFDAALACDYDALEAIASESEGFTFTYGGETDASEYWRDAEASTAEPKPLRALAAILAMPHTRNEAGSYAWPTAYSESPTPEAWQALVDAGLYTQEQVELMQAQGIGYLGYRTAITPEGEWQFFVAGD